MTALCVILVISLLKMAGIDILPGYDTVRVVEKGASIPITEGVKATAKQLASLGIVIPGITARDVKVLSMSVVIQIIMIVAAALIIIFCKAKPKAAMQGVVWQNGMVAVVAIYGIAWMSNTYFDNYQVQMQNILSEVVTKYPWTIALGIEGWILLGVMPSVYGYFFIPNYSSDIATVNFDRSGTTIIGKYLLNHSFMIPGLIHVVCATIAGLGISYVYHFIFKLY